MSTYRFTVVGKDATKAMFRSIKTGLGGVRSAVNSTQVRFAALAGVAGIGAMVNASRQTIDTMAKMSDRLNIGTEDLAAFHHLTQLNGESTDSFDKSLEKMTRSVGEAQRGLGTGKIALEQMGIKVDDLAKLDAGKQFEVIAESISKVENQSQKASLAADIFGRSGVKLLNTINQGADGIANARSEVEEYGLSLSRVDAAKVEDANDQLFRVGQVAKGLGQKITVKLAPILGVVSEKLIGAATEGDRMGKFITGALNFSVKAAGVFADGIRGIKIIFVGLKTVVTGFAAAALGVFTGLAESVFNVGQGIKTAFLKAFREVFEVAARFSDKAKESLASINEQLNNPPKTPAFIATLNNAQDHLTEVIRENRAELQELLLADLPSAVIEQKWAEIQAEAERRAAETAAKIQNQLANGGNAQGDISGLGETEAEKAAREAKEQRERDSIARRLQMIDEANLSELQRMQVKFAQELQTIQLAEDQKLLTEESAQQRRLQVTQRFEDAKTRLTKAGQGARRAAILSGLSTIASMQNTGSKKMFKVQKAAALAQAAVSLPAAVVDSFKNAGGYPWGLIPAAAMLATGIQQIQNIKKQQFGGGSGSFGGISGGGSGPSVPGTAGAGSPISPSIGGQFAQGQGNQAPATIVQFNITGDVNGSKAEAVLEEMSELIEGKDFVLFSKNSRQALELVPG